VNLGAVPRVKHSVQEVQLTAGMLQQAYHITKLSSQGGSFTKEVSLVEQRAKLPLSFIKTAF
jgi:hypothetical protein